MGKTSARALRSMGAQAFQTSQALIDQITQYAKRPLPVFNEEAALGYMSTPEKMSGELIQQILSGGLYEQPGVKTRFKSAIESPIMDVLREQTMPQIAASTGKGGTYFSTMRGQAEIDAQQAAADKIAELEGGFILNAMGQAIPAGMQYGDVLQQRWQRMQPEWGGGNVPLIKSALESNAPLTQTGADLAAQYEAIASQERQARMAGISSGFGSAMGAGGQAAGGGCCFMFIMGEGGITEDVEKFKHSNYPYDSDVANGYRLMSLKLMPYIRRNKFVKTLVRKLITSPISKFAKYYYKKDLRCFMYSPVGLFWTIIWGLLGKASKYNSESYQKMVKELGI